MTRRKSGDPSVAWTRMGMRFCWFTHLILACANATRLVNYGPVYITTTSRGYTSTEIGSPVFECYRSSPFLQASVSRGRYAYTYNDINNPANGDLPASEGFMVDGSNVEHYRTNLETSDFQSYGVFYCASALDGDYTSVPTIFLRSDAKFVPTSGRYSKTVNQGDVNVTIEFTEVSPADATTATLNWRFNGTVEGDDTLTRTMPIFKSLTTYTLIGEVNTTNGGVYELHWGGERGQARAGLFRLIVRACPAGRYDASEECSQICPSCRNGGICHDEIGTCVCPPGFQGDNCEMGCGGNRFGRNCEYRCSYDIGDDQTACSGLQVCVPDPYGCSCTPGYKGLDCTTECDAGEFGASCTETCRCVSGECDRFTGVCTGSSTECADGWTGTNCQDCVAGRYGPNCDPLMITYIKANQGQLSHFVCRLVGGNVVSTAVPNVQLYRRTGSGPFTQEGISRNGMGPPPDATFLFLVSDVKVGEEFFCDVFDVNSFRSEPLTTDGEFVQPDLPSPPVVSATTNESVTLMWDAWDASTDIGDPPLDRYSVMYRLNSSQGVSDDFMEVTRADQLAPSETVTGLSPDTDYVFAVAAWRRGVGGRGALLEVRGSTSCSPPSEGPSSVNITTNGTEPGQVFISWENPPANGSNCRSIEGGVRIYYTRSDISSGIAKRAADPNEQSVDVPFDTTPSEYTLELEPFSQYVIQVVVYNRDSETPRGEGFSVVTPEMVAPAPTVTIETTSEDSITVYWSAATPAHLNGFVQGYELRYTQTKPEPQAPVTVSIDTSELVGLKYVITEGVTKESEFEVQVRVLNGAGSGEWSPIKTSPSFNSGGGPNNVALIAGIVIGFIIVILLIIILVLALRASKRKSKKIGGITSTELVDNVLYESSLPPGQNGNTAGIHDRPLVRNPADTEYAYVSHERNSLLEENLDLTLRKEPTYDVASEKPTSPNGKSQTLPLLSGDITLDALQALYAKPDKRSDVKSVPDASPTLKEAGTDAQEGELYENVKFPGAILVENLVEHVEYKKAQEKDGFIHEFGLLSSDEGIPRTVALKPENKAKNRFKNIVAFDRSRVVLEAFKDDPHSDYYNANYIRDDKGKKSFIASQAPNAASLNDFWRLIWQENICSVVMVTNTVEGGKDRCTVYWPKEMGSSKTFGAIDVKLRAVEEFSDHVHRIMDVKLAPGGETRSVHQFHYLSWPDMGVPQYPTTLISFTQSVKHVHEKITANTKSPTPMLVHCSAGVGRTGTFITLYCMLGQVHVEQSVNIFGFIQRMREDRPYMVQTADQYILIHTALVEAYLSGNTDVPVGHFEAKLISLKEINPATQKPNIDQEYEILNQLTPAPGPQAFKAAGQPANIDKNRFPNILSMEKNRPCLVTQGESGSTDYINASFLNTFMKKDVFIATQMPLPHTTGDIWRMVYDWRCPVIVMLNDLDTDDKSCAQYWPNKDSVSFGPLTVSIVAAETIRSDYVMRKFEIKGPKKGVLTLKQFQLMGWDAKKSTPDSVTPMLKLVDAVSECVRRSQASGPIVIHCINGIGRSGVFAALYSAAEKMITDSSVDIFQAVKRLRANRPGMVESVDQYRICYEGMAEYMKKFDEYANLNM